MKKIHLLAATAFILWAPIPWLYFGHPSILAGQPLSVYAVVLCLGGLSMAASALYGSLQQRRSINTARFYTSLFILAFVGAYQFSGLAPSWDCLGKRFYVSVAKAQSGCTTTCTDNDKKPCSGWSSCWDKFVSCNSAGKDQDGRNCQGCCFSCTVTCPTEEPPPDPTNTPVPPATRTATPTWTPTPIFTSTFTPTYAATSTLTPTNTANATFTPSPTPTNTATATFTASPTSTFTATLTNTPSPTPTPLPPVITGQMVCELWGDSGWCRGDEKLELKASDPQGFDVTIYGDLNGIPFSCASSCIVPLQEGVGIANYVASSSSGRTAVGTSSWRRDGTSPNLNAVMPDLDGKNGWYVSRLDFAAKATDLTSGLLSISASLDGGSTWSALPVHLEDGVHSVMLRAIDLAGNETLIIQDVLVDTRDPTSRFVSPFNRQLAQGDITITGNSVDDPSGIASTELSLDNGMTWQSVQFVSDDAWSFLWRTRDVPNGEYKLLVRGVDVAGNIGSTSSVTLVVDNDAPYISLTNHWWIWESGRLLINTDYFPLKHGMIVIADAHGRWPSVRIPFGENYPSTIKWDRRFANGILAPSGNYRVTVSACNIHDLCSEKSASIKIPWYAVEIPTSAAPTELVELEHEPEIHITRPVTTTVPPAVNPSAISPEVGVDLQPKQSTRSLLPIVVFVALLWVLSASALADRRPGAIHAIAKTITMQNYKGEWKNE
jgi:hypothetical protein